MNIHVALPGSILAAVLLAACTGEDVAPTAEARTGASPAAAAVRAAAPGPRSGEAVYRAVCAACHGTGAANAPRFGDRETWKTLIEEGQAVVTAHGWVGVRGMPPKGGRDDITLEEFGRAVAWMARNAGADWQDPDAPMLEAIRDEEAKRIESLRKKAAG